jgi:hypothetical protein
MKEFGKVLMCLMLLTAPIMYADGQVRKFHISGTVIDSVSKEPIPFLTVFVPNSTIATLTDEKGKFTLTGIPLSTSELVFSHLNYGTQKIWLASELTKSKEILIQLPLKVFNIEEVEIAGKLSRRAKAEREEFLKVFYQYFLGDSHNNECQLVNPQVLRFKKEGSRVYASSSSPLIIHNNHLGYDIQYYMDYFVANDVRANQSTSQDCYYSFQGIALYKEMTSPDTALEQRWAANRRKNYVGSLANFLSSLYRDSLVSEHYRIFKTSSTEKLALLAPLKDAGKKKGAERLPDGKVFYYNEVAGQPGELFYSLRNEINLREYIQPGLEENLLVLKFRDSLLVMKDTMMTPALEDDETTLFFIGNGQIHFRPDGDYQVYNSDLHWTSLDSQKKMIKLLPLNYQPGLLAP